MQKAGGYPQLMAEGRGFKGRKTATLLGLESGATVAVDGHMESFGAAGTAVNEGNDISV